MGKCTDTIFSMKTGKSRGISEEWYPDRELYTAHTYTAYPVERLKAIRRRGVQLYIVNAAVAGVSGRTEWEGGDYGSYFLIIVDLRTH